MMLDISLNTSELPEDGEILRQYKKGDLLVSYFFGIKIQIDNLHIEDGICLAGINAWDAVEKLMRESEYSREIPVFSGTHFDMVIEKIDHDKVSVHVFKDENIFKFSINRPTLIKKLSEFLVELYSSCIHKCPKSLEAEGLYSLFKERLVSLRHMAHNLEGS